MKVRPLVIDDKVTSTADNVRAYAEAHRHNIHDVMAVVKGTRPSAGKDPQHSFKVPFGYFVTYSIEEQPQTLGWCHHVSVSIDDQKLTPHPHAVVEICRLFAPTFNVIEQATHIWQENAPDGSTAINVLISMAKFPGKPV